MIARMIGVRFLAILIGVTLFILTLEVVSYSKEILALHAGHSEIMLKYIFMRSPATLVTFIPISFLIAVLLTLTELSYRNELTAIWASGISPLRLIVMLSPVAIVAGLLHFALGDRAVPAAAPTLRTWAIADYGEKQLKLGEKDPIWLRGGNDVLRVGNANASSTELDDVLIFQRDSDGILTSQIKAQHGELKGNVWSLTDVRTTDATTGLTRLMPRLEYEGHVRPATAGARSGDPEEMTFDELGYFIANSGFGIRPTYVYQTWWHKRFTALVTCLTILGICVPLASRFRRGGGLGILFAVGIGLGFVYFIMDGMMASAGELGFVTPWLAAWLPVVAFGILGTSLVLRSERN